MRLARFILMAVIALTGIMAISACAPTPALPTTEIPGGPISTQTAEIVPTDLPTSTVTPSQIPTQAPTETPVATAPALITINPLGKTNCRTLPYGTSLVVGYLRIGDEAVAIGKDARGEWVLIENPDKKDGSFCWIALVAVKVTGDPATLPFSSAVQK